MPSQRAVVLSLRSGTAVVLDAAGRFRAVQPGAGWDEGMEVWVDDAAPAGARRHRWPVPRWAAGAAVAAVLVLAAVPAVSRWQSAAQVDAYVSVDINPSVELQLNAGGVALRAVALDADGARVLREVNVTGQPVTEAVDTLVAQSVKDGFLRSGAPGAVVITISAARAGPIDAVVARGVDQAQVAVQKTLSARGLKVPVVGAEVTPALRLAARHAGLSPGKYLVLQRARRVGLNVTAKELRQQDIVQSLLHAGVKRGAVAGWLVVFGRHPTGSTVAGAGRPVPAVATDTARGAGRSEAGAARPARPGARGAQAGGRPAAEAQRSDTPVAPGAKSAVQRGHGSIPGAALWHEIVNILHPGRRPPRAAPQPVQRQRSTRPPSSHGAPPGRGRSSDRGGSGTSGDQGRSGGGAYRPQPGQERGRHGGGGSGRQPRAGGAAQGAGGGAAQAGDGGAAGSRGSPAGTSDNAARFTVPPLPLPVGGGGSCPAVAGCRGGGNAAPSGSGSPGAAGGDGAAARAGRPTGSRGAAADSRAGRGGAPAGSSAAGGPQAADLAPSVSGCPSGGGAGGSSGAGGTLAAGGSGPGSGAAGNVPAGGVPCAPATQPGRGNGNGRGGGGGGGGGNGNGNGNRSGNRGGNGNGGGSTG